VIRLALLLCITSHIFASPLTIHIADRSTDGRCTAVGGEVVLLHAETDAEEQHLRIEPGAKHAEADVPANTAARVAARKAGCWSTTLDVMPGEQAVTLDLFPAARLTGSISTAAAAPSSVAAVIVRSRTERMESTACTFVHPSWTCAIPAGVPIDVRLTFSGFAPLHFWDIEAVPDEQRTVPAQRLIPGASLSGWIEDAEGNALADAAVALMPLQAEHTETVKTAARYTANSDRRGFFLLTGVAPGTYRLVSRKAGLSPAVVPSVTLRAHDAVTWPNTLQHVALTSLEVQLDPALDHDGKPWQVTLREEMPLVPGARPAEVQRSSKEGRWSASGLRADRYRLEVRDAKGAVHKRETVDLTAGTPAPLQLKLDGIVVRGTVTIGDTPLEAAVRLSTASGHAVRVTTDEDGKFEGVLPVAGEWRPVVIPASSQTQIAAAPIHVPENPDSNIEIRLLGGRVQGTVSSASGGRVRAAVHLVRNGRPVAQQITEKDGTFDFVGVAAAEYELSAEAEAASTAEALRITVEEDSTTDVVLVVVPQRRVAGVVITPDGRPASGAVIRMSIDGGRTWSDSVAGMRGEFSFAVSGATAEAQLIVLAYGYPAKMLATPIDAAATELTIALASAGGKLHTTKPAAYVLRNRAVAAFPLLFPPSPADPFAAYLEPGSYAVCAAPVLDTSCVRVEVSPGVVTRVPDVPSRSKETP
jgi:hypothetical protein